LIDRADATYIELIAKIAKLPMSAKLRGDLLPELKNIKTTSTKKAALSR